MCVRIPGTRLGHGFASSSPSRLMLPARFWHGLFGVRGVLVPAGFRFAIWASSAGCASCTPLSVVVVVRSRLSFAVRLLLNTSF